MICCVLGSGSSGNAIYIQNGNDAILIDQGFSHQRIRKRLESRGLDDSRIKAVFVSHEHTDHMRGVGVTARKLDVPVYGTRATLAASNGVFHGDETLNPIDTGVEVAVGPFTVRPFAIPHDAADPVHYVVSCGRRRVAVATDLGFVSTLVEQSLNGADLVVLESNHDLHMLKTGPYTWPLKQRVMSRKGHLSNRNAAEFLFNICSAPSSRCLKGAVLAHLSEENNDPEVARREVLELFAKYDRRIGTLEVAAQHDATRIFEL